MRISVRLESRILVVRGHRVLLDADLAGVYGVSTSALNQALKRNHLRFPADFAFQLSAEDVVALRSQFVISKTGRGGRRTRPWAFTEHGAVMAASVLNSSRAVDMSIFVVRAFVQLRTMSESHATLAAKLAGLERRVGRHDRKLAAVIAALRRLVMTPAKPRRAIGFRA